MGTFSPDSLDPNSASAILREGMIERKGDSFSQQQQSDIRQGKQDQALGFDDAVYALTHAPDLWDKAQDSMKSLEGAQT